MRYSIAEKILEEEEIFFYDLASIPWDSFPFKEGYEEYSLNEVNIPRFTNLMIERYGNPDYWDIILLLNNILNPIEDLYPTLVIKLPNISELRDFIKQYTVA